MSNKITNINLGISALLSISTLVSSSLIAQECQPLVWSDEFDGASLNTSNWDIQLGDGCDQGPGMCGWGNSELQSYQAANLTVANGILSITAKKERIKGTKYTSGRIRTANMPNSGEWSFGRFEARIKIPNGQGMWPAFWMLPTDPVETWPTSGEIDVMESTGQSSMMAYGTIHFGQAYPYNRHTGAGIPKQPDKWSDDFHVYAIEWEQNEIRWYVDNILYSTKTPADLTPEAWPFDGTEPFHLLLNLAVGGTWGGDVDETALPQSMDVDYVRVYAGNQATLEGEHLSAPNKIDSYSLHNAGSNVTWIVSGGTVLSASSTQAQIQWDLASAGSTQNISVDLGNCIVTAPVYVSEVLTTETVLEDYNGTTNMDLVLATGEYNVSGGLLTYTRDGLSQYDVIATSTTAIPDAGAFVTGKKAFRLEVDNQNPALIGKQILVQLENSAVATPDNFPGGRHSVYTANIEHANGIQSLEFKMNDRLDTNTSDNSVDSIIFLIDPNSFNSDVYVLDNIEIIGATGGQSNQAPVAVLNYSCTDLTCDFDGSTSSDADGNIVSHQWDFGDGNTGSGAVINHSYAVDGVYQVTLTVTDDLSAQNQSQSAISVTSGGAEQATSTVISSVTTGTQGAGKGQKSGTAHVLVLDDLGNAVKGVTVTGNFTGTFNETSSAVTDASGNAEFITSGTAAGAVTVNFCVSQVSGGLPLDPSASNGLCQ
ncbi:family 16 glycosylhydrolase [Paraglaciecola aestuariivivens]